MKECSPQSPQDFISNFHSHPVSILIYFEPLIPAGPICRSIRLSCCTDGFSICFPSPLYLVHQPLPHQKSRYTLQKNLMNFKSANYQSRHPETSSSADASYDVQSVSKENLHHLRSLPEQLLKPYSSYDTLGNIPVLADCYGE